MLPSMMVPAAPQAQRAPHPRRETDWIVEVDLDYDPQGSTAVVQGDEVCGDLFLQNGADIARIIITAPVTGEDLVTFCATKRWDVTDRSMVVTREVGNGGRTRTDKFEPKQVPTARVLPTTKTVEFLRPLGAKG